MRQRRVWRMLLATIALLVTGAAGAAAQQATIVGQVTDEAGTGLANVQVVAIHQVTGAERGTYTNASGQFLIRNLKPRGPYRIEARRIGYGTDFAEVAGLDPAPLVTAPPLLVGMYTTVHIEGQQVDRYVVLPRSALRDGGSVWVVRRDSVLAIEPAEVIQEVEEQVYLRAPDVGPGERVVTTDLDVVTDGMTVRVAVVR